MRENFVVMDFDFDKDSKSATLRADRDRGAAPINNIYSAGLIDIPKNSEPKEVLPWYKGANNEPEYLIKLVIDNPIAMGLIGTKVAILHGTGLGLYQEGESGMIRMKPEDWPEEIKRFYEYNSLNDWAYACFMDFEMLGNFFTSMSFSKGSKLADVPRKVVRINRIDPTTVRAIKPNAKKGQAIKEYIVASLWKDFTMTTDHTRFKAFNWRDYFDHITMEFLPGEAKTSRVLAHGRRPFPGFPHYGLPRWYGARKTGELQNEIPHWHIANIINMWGIRMRVSVNQEYINTKLQKINQATGKNYTADEINKELTEKFHNYCTNPQNVGKVLLDTYYMEPGGKDPQRDFIIENIEVTIKDEAYVKISEAMNSFFTSAFDVNPSLANVITTKGMSSGSEQTQAWNIADAKANYERSKVLEVLNFIHRFNSWDSEYPGIYWGFENPKLVTKDISKTGQTEPANAEPVATTEEK
jgi:hypothetical protein